MTSNSRRKTSEKADIAGAERFDLFVDAEACSCSIGGGEAWCSLVPLLRVLGDASRGVDPRLTTDAAQVCLHFVHLGREKGTTRLARMFLLNELGEIGDLQFV